MKIILLISALCSLLAVGASASPTLTVAKVSGRAGRTVRLPIALNPGSDSVASLQFSLILPPNVSTVSVTAGSLMTSSGKSIGGGRKDDVWTFIVYGARNQNAMGKGALLTAVVKIASGTAAGTLTVPISNVVYSNALGESIPGGASAGGAIKVTP